MLSQKGNKVVQLNIKMVKTFVAQPYERINKGKEDTNLNTFDV